MGKRGQVALFVIVGLLILVTVIIFIHIRTGFLNEILGRISEKAIVVPSQLKIVEDFVQDCLDKSSKDSLYYVGRNGGYYDPPFNTSIIWFFEEIPYYYLDNKIYVPTIHTVENELSKSISNEISLCLNFTQFKKEGFIINSNNYTVHTNVLSESVAVKMEYAIKIEKSGVKAEFKTFEFREPSNFNTLLSVSQDLVASYSVNPGFICLTCLDELSQKNKVTIKSWPMDDPTIFKNNIIWFAISDKEYQIDETRNLTLRFIVQQ